MTDFYLKRRIAGNISEKNRKTLATFGVWWYYIFDNCGRLSGSNIK